MYTRAKTRLKSRFVRQAKRILFLTDNFPPEVNAPASRTYEHAREWVREGFVVTVITCAPNFPHGKVYKGYSNKLFSKEIINGIKVIRVWTYIAPNKGFFKRILDFMTFGFMAFFMGLFIRTDVVVATSPQLFTALAGKWLSFIKLKPWIMEVRDLWPESIAAVGLIDKGFVYNFLEKIELRLYKSASKIIVVTETFKRNIAKRGIAEKKIYIHKNGVNLSFFSPRPKDKSLLKTYPKLENKKVFAYIGTHGMAHGLSFILKTLPRVQKELPQAYFLFIGEGAEKDNLIKQAKHLELTNVTFISFVPKDQVVRYLSLMDVALVNLIKSDTFKTVIPSKIFEAAALHKPILLGLQGETQDLIESYNAGICFEPENEEEFVYQCRRIIETPTYIDLQEGCEKLAEAYNRKKIAVQVLKTITEDL